MRRSQGKHHRPGPSGTGKTQRRSRTWMAASQRGLKVRFIDGVALVHDLIEEPNCSACKSS